MAAVVEAHQTRRAGSAQWRDNEPGDAANPTASEWYRPISVLAGSPAGTERPRFFREVARVRVLNPPAPPRRRPASEPGSGPPTLPILPGADGRLHEPGLPIGRPEAGGPRPRHDRP